MNLYNFKYPPLSGLHLRLKEEDLLPAAFLEAPDSPFSPEGAWTNTYLIWETNYEVTGSQTLRRIPLKEGTFKLEIQTAILHTHCVHETTAELYCKSDILGTPKRWKIVSAQSMPDGRYLEETRVEETGELEGSNAKVVVNGHPFMRQMPGVFTSNWSLLEAIQRVSITTLPLGFDLLEEMDMLKVKQLLSFGREVQLELDGKDLALGEYRQTGQGILPYHYLVDGNSRLLVAGTGTRLFMFNPAARQIVEEVKQKRWHNG